MKKLMIEKDVLPFKKYKGSQGDLFNRLIKYIELKKDNVSKGYVEVVNPCPWCKHKQDSFNEFSHYVHPCDIWHFPIEDENEDDWLEVMGDWFDFSDEEIKIYRCQNCEQWFIDHDK